MGFATKLTMGFTPKGKPEHEVALSSPDTQFGPKPTPASQESGAAASSAPEAATPLSLGNVLRRKPAATEAEQAQELQLPLIGHLSLARQLRILLVTFAVGILLTIVALWQNAASNVIASAQTQIASDALMH